MVSPRWFAFLSLPFLSACEQEIEVDVKVTIPVDVQALYSKQSPGRIMVGMDVPKSSVGWYSAGILCDPTTEPLVATVHHEGFGCAKEGTVRAWIVPASPGQEPVQCGLVAAPYNNAPGASAETPQGTATVFKGKTGNVGCTSGKDKIDITVQRP